MKLAAIILVFACAIGFGPAALAQKGRSEPGCYGGYTYLYTQTTPLSPSCWLDERHYWCASGGYGLICESTICASGEQSNQHCYTT